MSCPFDLLTGDRARKAFDISQEKNETREKYGRNSTGQSLLLARRLIEAGTRLVNVAAWTGLARAEKFVSVETWDIYRGVMPFVAIQLLALAALAVLPELATWLPSVVYGR